MLSDKCSPFIVDTTQQLVSNKKIQWNFPYAKAPWYGVFWKRLIGQVNVV